MSELGRPMRQLIPLDHLNVAVAPGKGVAGEKMGSQQEQQGCVSDMRLTMCVSCSECEVVHISPPAPPPKVRHNDFD
jgi:hypothetical protein